MPCTATTRSGQPCKAPALRGRDLCYHHAPELAVARREARRRGGLASHGLTDGHQGRQRLRELDDVLVLLEVAAGDLLAREPGEKRARALAYVAGRAHRVLVDHDLEDRLDRLEILMDAKRRTHEP